MSDPNAREIQLTQVAPEIAELITRAEYDVQIATARKYPRSIKEFINRATEMVTLNESVADDCIYALPRDGKTIEGPSARFAELILHAWGHTRAGARIVNEDSRFITAQGVCHDLQSNTLIAYEVRRRITKSNGNKYSDDMVGVTGNAASSIALRNAITKVIPKALWSPIYEEARKVVVGDATTLANRRAKALEHLQKFGATADMVFKKLNVKGVEEVTLDHLVVLRGIATALKEGDMTVDEVFAEEKPAPVNKTDAIKEKLKARAGETATVTQAATDSSPPEIKPTDPKPADLPTFNINAYNLNIAQGTKDASHGLIQVLTAYPAKDRPGIFLGSSGVMLVEAMRSHGLALDVKKIEGLGISLPPEEKDAPVDEKATGKTMFRKNAQGAAA
jgi:hypothetical protein